MGRASSLLSLSYFGTIRIVIPRYQTQKSDEAAIDER
jgi:hypothetical protein